MKSSTVIPPLLILIASQAFAGANPHFTLPLHAIWPFTFNETCTTPASQGVDCSQTGRPTVNLPAGATGPAVIYLFVHNHTAIAGLYTAFEFAPWTLIFSSFTCQPNQLGWTPSNPGGPRSGWLGTTFTCITNPSLQVIGYMAMNLTGSGCISQVEPWEGPVRAVDCDLNLDRMTLPGPDELRLGKVCVGSGGHDACDRIVPVEASTWGGIKAQYQGGSR